MQDVWLNMLQKRLFCGTHGNDVKSLASVLQRSHSVCRRLHRSTRISVKPPPWRASNNFSRRFRQARAWRSKRRESCSKSLKSITLWSFFSIFPAFSETRWYLFSTQNNSKNVLAAAGLQRELLVLEKRSTYRSMHTLTSGTNANPAKSLEVSMFYIFLLKSLISQKESIQL